MVDPAAAVGPPGAQFMMGGVGTAICIAALEAEAERPLINAATQFLNVAQPGEELRVQAELVQVGRKVTQARAFVRAGERELIAVQAALGEREAQPDAQFIGPPDVPRARECEERMPAFPELADLHSHMRKHVAFEDEAMGRARHWLGPIQGVPTAALLAVVADFLAGGNERTRGASSLDNIFRMGRAVETEWVLLDIEIQSIQRGNFHGTVNLFAEDGTLLATAAQSGAVPKLGTGWAHAHVPESARGQRGS